jgi:hypothetical protein
MATAIKKKTTKRNRAAVATERWRCATRSY